MWEGEGVHTQHHDAAILLRTEHAVARVLAEEHEEAAAYPRLLRAIGESLDWEVGAVWTPLENGDPVLRCVETWQGREPLELASRSVALAPGEGLPGRVWATGEPAWISDVRTNANFPRGPSAREAGLRAAFCFPIRGSSGVLGAIEFLAPERREADADLLETMTSLGGRIGQSVERWRAEDRLRESDARKSAILNAAFDSIILMDADGLIVEVNPAAERTFGYRAEEMVGRELAELIVPPDLREAHRQGVARFVATGEGRMVGHPVELPAMRADGSVFPVEIAITRPRLTGPPQFTGFLRDITARKRDEQALRSLADEQAALRRVATTVAGEPDEAEVFAVVAEEVGRLLGAESANLVSYQPEGPALMAGAWSAPGMPSVPVGSPVDVDGPTVIARIHRSGRPERVESYEGLPGKTAKIVRDLGFKSAVGAPVKLAGRLWGALIVFTVQDQQFPPDSERRIADFAELVALALANAEARDALAASRARIVEIGDAERRRLERNLHDGAQQQLVALALTLRMCGARLTEGGPEAEALLARANAELADALEELRELARGIHPSILTDRGLEPALEMLAGRASLPLELDVDLAERLPDPVEAAVYYVVAEALTNASKHAQASHVRVDVARGDGVALLEVHDDGIGGADQRAGSGLRGLCDRVEALGGHLDLVSPAGTGTTLRARIPIR
jgi:PAS domain S-box-containing protein